MSQTPLRIGIIGGSGLADALGVPQGRTEQPDTPLANPADHSPQPQS
ncbi:MAG: MTAP family purine nucleoside phosphorylase, partial [Phycisphaerales bacterium]|nr:MTAP family purine nucleoside phosphorylase [Phycisphaerales bacterium]